MKYASKSPSRHNSEAELVLSSNYSKPQPSSIEHLEFILVFKAECSCFCNSKSRKIVICTDWKFQVKLSFVPIGWPFTVQGAPIPILGERSKMNENLLTGM